MINVKMEKLSVVLVIFSTLMVIVINGNNL